MLMETCGRYFESQRLSAEETLLKLTPPAACDSDQKGNLCV